MNYWPIIECTLWCITFVAFLWALGRAKRYQQERNECRECAERWIKEHNSHIMATKKVGEDFMNACRLIDIRRDGRVNHFTFARGEEIFIIETMGLLSDNPNEWRKQAGLMYVA